MSQRTKLIVLCLGAVIPAWSACAAPPTGVIGFVVVGAQEQPETPAVPEDEPDEPETELVLTDGRRVTGVLVNRTDSEIVLKISGIPTPFPADSVAQIKTGMSVMERYREMRRTIDDADIEQRLRLAEWLRARRKYRLALEEVAGILRIDPNNADARQLQVWLDEQVRLAPAPPPVKTGPVTEPAERALPKPQPTTRAVFPLLTPEQINIIRVYEVDLNDPPRMLVERDAITALLTQYAGNASIPDTREGREAVYRKRPSQILEMMFQLKARDLYERVQIQEDPTSMRLFRDRVHSTWLMNSCATTQCHGGQDAGRLWLSNKRPSADATVYTNFLILDRFALTRRPGIDPDDDPGAPARRLIDYDDPARSPLLQMGLPTKESLYPHPQVRVGGRRRGFTPVFQTVEDRRFQDAVQWIRAMYRPRPDYPVQYDPPHPAGGDANPLEPPKPGGER